MIHTRSFIRTVDVSSMKNIYFSLSKYILVYVTELLKMRHTSQSYQKCNRIAGDICSQKDACFTIARLMPGLTACLFHCKFAATSAIALHERHGKKYVIALLLRYSTQCSSSIYTSCIYSS